MTTNQTYVISKLDTPAAAPASLTALVNSFITNGIALGYINFQVLPVTVADAYDATNKPTEKKVYTAQINYYDPSIMG